MNALDLFAGPGGWDWGARNLGIEPLGIEWDEAACETRRVVGLQTLRADVAALDPDDYTDEPLDLLIASPPCQAWSMAGKRQGQLDIAHVYGLTKWIAGTEPPPDREPEWADERSRLVTEPIRWINALRPRYVACEQVPPVLDYWRFVAGILEGWGYSTWTGILEAERYGVPQTRERAILIASLEGTVHPPAPTHQRYVPGEPQLDGPELTLEGEILPWVSMAEALGWGMTARPYPVIASGRSTGGPDKEKVGGSSARQTIYDEQEAGRWEGKRLATGANTRPNEGPGRHRPEGLTRDTDKPAPTVDSSAGNWKLRANAQDNAAERDVDEPAPTITGGHDHGERRWLRAGTNDHDIARPEDEPAPTLRFGARKNAVDWVPEDDWKDGQPTHLDTRQSHMKARPVDEPGPSLLSQGLAKGVTVWTDDPAQDTTEGTAYKPTKGVRVSLEEAAVLQGFPPDYPFQGSKTKRFEQVGNAVPPPLAEAVLRALVGEAAELREAA